MDQTHPTPSVNETEFEKPRGIRKVEVRTGFAQANISGLSEPLVQARIQVLEAVAEAGVSLDFLKLTPAGMSFLVTEEDTDILSAALDKLGVRYAVQKDQRIVLVHAVNMRDEEGLLAGIVVRAIGSGARIDHASDMHDRMLLVMSAEEAERVRSVLETATAGVKA